MSSRQQPPEPRGLPLVGHSLQWLRDPCGFRERCAETDGDVVRYRAFGERLYMVTDPDAIRRVLVDDADAFGKPASTKALLGDVLGEGLVLSEGEQWRRQRERVQPAFAPGNVAAHGDAMVAQTEAMLADWRDGDTVDVKAAMQRLTLRIIVEAMFGTDVDLAERGVFESVTALRERYFSPTTMLLAGVLPGWVPIPALRRGERGLEYVESLVSELVDRRRDEAGTSDDLLGTLLHARDGTGETMSEPLLRDELVTLFFAGHETTAMALAFTWHLLATRPEVQQRLREEVASVCGDGPPSVDELSSLTATDRVLREALRLYPPVHEIRRETRREIDLCGYPIPEGAVITLPTWVLHRDDRFWIDPKTFRPDRWTSDAQLDRPDYAYFPFGGGPRHCIGRRFATTEAKLVLATVLQNYRLRPEYDGLDVSAVLTLQPDGPLPMTVRTQSATHR